MPCSVHITRCPGAGSARIGRIVLQASWASGQRLRKAQRVIVPALTNQLLSLTKNSSLAVAVGYPELVSVANMAIGNTGRAFECIAIVMGVYLALSLVIAALMNAYNKRVALRGWS